MDERFHAFEKEVEEWHWWYQVRRDILDLKLSTLGLDPDHARLLDVGCGTGGASLVLSRYGRVVAVDRAPASFKISMDRPYAHRVVARFGDVLPFAESTFDVVCALDILEHLDDDLAGAQELYRVTRPGGHAILFAPAFAFLWGYNDVFSHHKRRYDKRQLAAVVERAGFRITESGYFNMVLFAPTLAARMLQRVFPKLTDGMEHSTRPSPWNGLLARLFRLELGRLKNGGMPVGTSTYCVGQKAGSPPAGPPPEGRGGSRWLR
jgi:SAM-dependent methyltransferase